MSIPGVDPISSLTLEERLALRHGAERLEAEFAGICERDTIDEYVAASYRSLIGAARIDRFVPLLAERFARQRLVALSKIEGRHQAGIPTVVFLDEHNAGRSQMGMAFLNTAAGGRVDAWSGGKEPADRIPDVVVEAMHEVGISLAGEYPKPWTPEVLQAADTVVCSGTEPPAELAHEPKLLVWDVPDPIDLALPQVRRIRDEMRERVDALVAAHTS